MSFETTLQSLAAFGGSIATSVQSTYKTIASGGVTVPPVALPKSQTLPNQSATPPSFFQTTWVQWALLAAIGIAIAFGIRFIGRGRSD